MGIIGDHHDVLWKSEVELAGDLHDLVEGGVITAHGEDAVGDHQNTPRPTLSALDGLLESRHVEMWVDRLVEGAR